MTRLRGAYHAFRSLGSYGPEDDIWYQKPFTLAGYGPGNIDQQSALGLSTCYRCMRILSDSVSQLPIHLYERLADGSRRRADERVAAKLLNQRPNNEMSAFQYKANIMACILAWGNHYSYVARNARGVRDQLIPLSPSRVTVKRDESTNELVYEFQPTTGAPILLSQHECLHFKGFGYNGLVGRSIISLAKEAISLGLSQEAFSNTFYSQGTLPGAVVTHPGSPKPETVKNLKDAIHEQVGGLQRSNRLLFLQEGMKLDNVTIKPVDAEFIASRKLQVQDIARFFGVPSHLVNDSEATKGKSNISVESLDFLKFTLSPYLKSIEAELNSFFLNPDEQSHFYFEFLVDALLRTDTLTRYKCYEIGRQSGWLSANQILARENMPLLPPEIGDMLLSKPGTLSLQQLAAGVPEGEGLK